MDLKIFVLTMVGWDAKNSIQIKHGESESDFYLQTSCQNFEVLIEMIFLKILHRVYLANRDSYEETIADKVVGLDESYKPMIF
jgi:hypothetical protein